MPKKIFRYKYFIAIVRVRVSATIFAIEISDVYVFKDCIPTQLARAYAQWMRRPVVQDDCFASTRPSVNENVEHHQIEEKKYEGRKKKTGSR